MYMVWSPGSPYLNTAGVMEVCYDTLEWLTQKVGEIYTIYMYCTCHKLPRCIKVERAGLLFQ